MKNPKDWKKYNRKLVKRGMILFDPAIIPNFYKDVKKKRKTISIYKLIFFMILIKFMFTMTLC